MASRWFLAPLFGFASVLSGCLGTPPVNVTPVADTTEPVDTAGVTEPDDGASTSEDVLEDVPEDVPEDLLAPEDVLPDVEAEETVDAQVTDLKGDDATAPPGCSLATLKATVGCGEILGGFDVWGATVADWNDDGCDDVIVPRPNTQSLVVLFGDLERSLSCGIEIPLTSAGQGIAPYRVAAGALCGDAGSSPVDLYVLGKRGTDPWLGRWTRSSVTDVSGVLVGGTLPPETYFTPGERPGYMRLADLDGAGPPDLLFGDLYSSLFSVLGDCGAAFALIESRLSADAPADGTSREVWFATPLGAPARVFTGGGFVASLHSVDGAGNLVNPTYAPVATTDGYDAHALTPNPPDGRVELVSGLEFDVVFSRYDVTGALFRELDTHATPPEPIGTPEFAFVLDPDPDDGVMSLLFVDTKGNDVGSKVMAVHWFPTAAVIEGQLELGSLVTRRWDKESAAPGFMAQEVFWADLDGSGTQRLLFLGQSGASQCLEVGEQLAPCD